MALGVLCPNPILQFWGNDGSPMAGGTVLTQVGGINTATYQDSALTIPLPNPIPLNSRGEVSSAAGASQQLFLTPNIVYSFTFSDASGNQQWVATYVNGVQVTITQVIVGQALWPQTPQELAAGVTPPSITTRLGMRCVTGFLNDSGATDNTSALQAALNANANAYPVIIPAGGYANLTARVTAPAGTHIIMQEGSSLVWSATTATGTPLLGSATRPGIEILGDAFIIEGKGTLIGPSVGIYTPNECGILRIGTSAAARGVGVIIRDIGLSQWGAYGAVLQFIEGIEVISTVSQGNGYMGYGFLSCQRGRVQRNKIYNIGPGTSSNMYGLSCNHDSTNYNTDPNVTFAPRRTVNPFCIDFDVSFNEVYSINWLGLDAHGGYELNYHDNKVYDCYIGIQIASSSGDAANYAGENNAICDNEIYATQINGNASTTSGHSGLQFGITVNGGSVLTHRAVRVIGNTIVGCGDTSGAGGLGYSIQASNVQDGVILGNVIRNWYSIGFYGTVFDGTISNNMLNAPPTSR